MAPRRPLLAALAAVALAAGLPGLARAVDLSATSPLLPPPDDAVPDPEHRCDPLDASLCMLPFPNDHFTVADSSTDTGRRIRFDLSGMPRNGLDAAAGETGGQGKPVEPAEWNRNDGFSPGSPVLVHVPGVDLHQTWGTAGEAHQGALNQPGYVDHRDHIADIGRYRQRHAPIVIVNADTGKRHPFWSELDLHPATGDDRRALILRPARNFEEGARYVVGLRHLKDAGGQTIDAGPAFAAYRSGVGADPARQAHFDTSVFPVLEGTGVARDELYLAWDFTVASPRNLTERMLSIRDEAFAALGDDDLADRRVAGAAPGFVIDSPGEVRDDGQWGTYRRVRGRVTVPNFLDRPQQTEGHVQGNRLPYDPPAPGSRFYDDPLDGDDLPDVNPVEPEVQVPFVCDVPLTGPQAEARHGAVLYGHGLLGTRDQIGDAKWPRRYGFAACAADWWGMSSVDLPTVATILADLSNFPSLADRAQQGFLNFLFLGRVAIHPEGLATHPAFQDEAGTPLLATASGRDTKLHYDGNSQGGIMGGSLVAVSPDIGRGILGVPAMNYSTLLNRSVDWEGAYGEVYYATYQDPLERQLGFALIQMLWDRAEANGYAHHLSNRPLPNTPKHDVMLQVAFSDHQVSNHAAEVEARTVGAPIMAASLPGAHWAKDPFIDLVPFPHQGSSLVYWDSGNATPPNGNLPPTHNGDPHGDPRNEPAAGWQEAHFLLTGWTVDVCAGGPYLTDDHPANGGQASCPVPDRAPGT